MNGRRRAAFGNGVSERREGGMSVGSSGGRVEGGRGRTHSTGQVDSIQRQGEVGGGRCGEGFTWGKGKRRKVGRIRGKITLP